MTVELVVEPKTPPLSWSDFVKGYPPYAIALDGFVKEGPQTTLTPGGPYQNYNHHEGVDRLATRSTCAQVLIGIRQGLFRAFRDQDGPRVRVYVNDCDEDVCTSWFLLKHSHLAEQTMNPTLNRLVGMEDMLDATAGAYPFPADLPALQELAWVFQPYRRFRLSGEIDRKDPAAYVAVVTDVEHRIMQHIAGKGKTIPPLREAGRREGVGAHQGDRRSGPHGCLLRRNPRLRRGPRSSGWRLHLHRRSHVAFHPLRRAQDPA